MSRAYLSAGSNLDDREYYLKTAADALAQAGIRLLHHSSIYETEPVGFADQPWFLNQVIEVQAMPDARTLLSVCQKIERLNLRTRTFKNAPRTLDLDILLFGSAIVQEPDLVIPHPRMTERRFVLEPMVEIAPDLVHPALRKTMRALLTDCPDSSVVKLFSAGARR